MNSSSSLTQSKSQSAPPAITSRSRLEEGVHGPAALDRPLQQLQLIKIDNQLQSHSKDCDASQHVFDLSRLAFAQAR